MEQNKYELNNLINSLLISIRNYGIKEVSMEQYEVTCRDIERFVIGHERTEYYDGLMEDYIAYIESREETGCIYKEYARFKKRVIRMLTSLAVTGITDFSSSPRCKRKYSVSSSSKDIIESVLDFHDLQGEARKEMDTVLRHFFHYAEKQESTAKVTVTDDLLTLFFTKELPLTNKGSMGRSLRAIKYLSAYLKSTGQNHLILDFTQLKARTASVRAIPPYSQDEISKMLSVIDTDTVEGLRDYAIILLAFETGLRGVDIKALRLQDIDWHEGKIRIRQSKTSEPLMIPISGKVMNAVADYILTGRPECNEEEIFLCVKGPVKSLDKRTYSLGCLTHKFSIRSNVELLRGRSFHSLRRSFGTELSDAGIPLETISQMLGHKSVEEDKPYLSYNREQIAFCSIGFDEKPITHGMYSGGDSDADI